MTTRALIIDDHAVVRSGIRRALETRGEILVFEAATKAEALAQIAHVSPQLLIIDINLPDGSGLEVVNWVRTISAEMAIVVLTFNESDDFLLAAMNAGASAYVNKTAPQFLPAGFNKYKVSAQRIDYYKRNFRKWTNFRSNGNLSSKVFY